MPAYVTDLTTSAPKAKNLTPPVAVNGSPTLMGYSEDPATAGSNSLGYSEAPKFAPKIGRHRGAPGAAKNANGAPSGYSTTLTTKNSPVQLAGYSSELEAREASAADSITRVIAVVDGDLSTKALDDVFLLEAKDPKHRMGNYLYVLNLYYSANVPVSAGNLYTWSDSLDVAGFKAAMTAPGSPFTSWASKDATYWQTEFNKFQSGVKYKGQGLNDKYLIKVVHGLIRRKGAMQKIDPTPTNSSGWKWADTGSDELYSTVGCNSHWNGNGWGIWVEGPDREFYANRMKIGKFQHSSFLAGKDVAAAGEWQVEAGVIKKLSARSGHYRPKFAHLMQALRNLKAKNVAQFDQILVALYFKAERNPKADPQFVKAGQLLQMTGADRAYKVDPLATE